MVLHPDMSFRGSECESRNLPEWPALSCVGPLSNVVDSSTPLCSGRNDIRYYVSTDSPTVSTMFHAAPRPSSGSPRRASFPRGKLLYRVGRHTVLFLRRDNRNAPGTAHRPFPTVSLVGPFFQPSWFKNVRFLARRDKRYHAPNRRIVNCQLSIVNCQFTLTPPGTVPGRPSGRRG